MASRTQDPAAIVWMNELNVDKEGAGGYEAAEGVERYHSNRLYGLNDYI